MLGNILRFDIPVPSSLKINAAIDDWLASVQPGCQLFAHLEFHIDKLREQDWPPHEIREFEETARRMLLGLVGEEPTGFDARSR
jgi:hypothetical protein